MFREKLPLGVPARIRTLLRRCLQKDPLKRLRDIGDARLEIEDGGARPIPPLCRRVIRRQRGAGA